MSWRWTQVNNWIQGKNYVMGAEIGVKEGRFIEFLLANNPNLTMLAVDPWEAQPEGNEDYLGWDFNSIYKQYRQKISPYLGRVIEIREYSHIAADSIPDIHLDFVFIDAQHDYESVKQDIGLWLPKVRKGGLICGHDHDDNFPGVVQAVKERFGKDYFVGSNAVWGAWV